MEVVASACFFFEEEEGKTLSESDFDPLGHNAYDMRRRRRTLDFSLPDIYNEQELFSFPSFLPFLLLPSSKRKPKSFCLGRCSAVVVLERTVEHKSNGKKFPGNTLQVTLSGWGKDFFDGCVEI